MLGLAAIWRWQKSGLKGACIALFLGSLIEHAFIYRTHFWNIGIEASVFLSLYISYLGFDFIRAWIEEQKEIQANLKTNYSNFAHDRQREKEIYFAHYNDLKNKYMAVQKMIADKEEKIVSYGTVIHELRQKTEKQEAEKKSFSQDLLHKDNALASMQLEIEDLYRKLQSSSDIKTLEEKNRELLSKFNALQQEMEKTAHINASLDQQLIEEIAQKKRAIQELEKKEQEFIQKEKTLVDKLHKAKQGVKNVPQNDLVINYMQLRKQFAQKSDILHQTRKELFAHTEENLALHHQKEQEELDLDIYEEALIKDIKDLEAERKILREENHLLEEMISYLNEQKSLGNQSTLQQQEFSF